LIEITQQGQRRGKECDGQYLWVGRDELSMDHTMRWII
jgi:hypothetical protein